MTDVKFCKDCKWCNGGTSEYPNCWQELSTYPPSLVTGKPKYPFHGCEYMRTTGSPCGPEGNLWEPRLQEVA